MKKTPVAVIGFLRRDVLEATLNNLAKAEGALDRDIYVYLSAPRDEADKPKTDVVRSLVEGFKRSVLPNIIIVLRDKNEGAGRNIRFAVTETLKKTGKAIIIEEDILVSRTFLNYMDAALDFYGNDKTVWCINGYQSPYIKIPKSYRYDVYLSRRNAAWGWGTWRDRWEAVDFDLKDWGDFCKDKSALDELIKQGSELPRMVQDQVDGKIDTWDVQCTYHIVKNRLFAIEPRLGLTRNIGFGDGVHCTQSMPFFTRQAYYNFIPKLEANLPRDVRIEKQFAALAISPSQIVRALRKLQRGFAYFKPNKMEPINVQ